MAVVRVHIWRHARNGDGGGWGHSALQVEGVPYISWWPESDGRQYMVDRDAHPVLAGFLRRIIGTTNVDKVRHRCNNNDQQDLTAEGGQQPEHVVEIADGVLNTEVIETWRAGHAL